MCRVFKGGLSGLPFLFGFCFYTNLYFAILSNRRAFDLYCRVLNPKFFK